MLTINQTTVTHTTTFRTFNRIISRLFETQCALFWTLSSKPSWNSRLFRAWDCQELCGSKPPLSEIVELNATTDQNFSDAVLLIQSKVNLVQFWFDSPLSGLVLQDNLVYQLIHMTQFGFLVFACYGHDVEIQHELCSNWQIQCSRQIFCPIVSNQVISWTKVKADIAFFILTYNHEESYIELTQPLPCILLSTIFKKTLHSRLSWNLHSLNAVTLCL